LPRLFDGDRTFRPNILADRAAQTGAQVAVRTGAPLSRSVSLGVEATVAAETGDFDFGKGSVAFRAAVIPGGPLAGGLTLAAGTSTGDVPVQSGFFLGGAGSLRGHAGGVARGDAFWLGRLEVGNTFPALRLIGFADIGWAGNRADFGRGRTLVGAGVGASFLDGLIRVDLARALKAPTGTRLEIYLDGLL
jgi:hemolysin activation/secretion protein